MRSKKQRALPLPAPAAPAAPAAAAAAARPSPLRRRAGSLPRPTYPTHTTHHTSAPCLPACLPRSITEFAEKPKGDALEKMRVDTTVLGALCCACCAALRLLRLTHCAAAPLRRPTPPPCLPPSLPSSPGLSPSAAKQQSFIASMGIYVFKKSLMLDLLEANKDSHDFGGEIIPLTAKDHKVRQGLVGGWVWVRGSLSVGVKGPECGTSHSTF